MDGIHAAFAHLPEYFFRPVRVLQPVDQHQVGSPALI